MTTPAWLWTLPLNIIENESAYCRVDRKLVAAIIMVETAGHDHCTRYEDAWSYPYRLDYYSKRNNITAQTEEVHQATSWGPMQIMGSVAREVGFEGNLPRLAAPLYGIRYGCRKLAQIFRTYEDLDDVISSYNQGSPRKTDGVYNNKSYVDKVKSYLAEFES